MYVSKINWTLIANKLDEILTIGNKIWQIAKNQKFTKASFSKKMGISRQTLDNWIAGLTSPDYNEVEKASTILGVPFGEQKRSFRDEIFEGDYIGLHKLVWHELAETMKTNRELLKDLTSTVKTLSGASSNK